MQRFALSSRTVLS